MCGIAGFTFDPTLPADMRAREAGALRRMVATLHHRGPDELTGLLIDGVGLGHTRLAIVDLEGGRQPMRDPASGLTVIFNGEIFNHDELRDQLRDSYRFQTRSDTEVILAGFLRWGIRCVERFNGQFAFVLYDPRDRSLHLARDRYGKRPLFYADVDGQLCFASEAKALFASGKVQASLDTTSLWETLHLWAPTDERSMFQSVRSLPPGSIAHRSSDGTMRIEKYWQLDFADDRVDHQLSESSAIDELEGLLQDAIQLRLRADVPVAAYLSGGLDSSLLCAMAQQQLGGSLQTFSVGFAQTGFDERAYQNQVAAALGTQHHSVLMRDADIAALLPAVVEHSEAVVLRSAPAPLFELSKLVRSAGTKVVLTGEGADEIFGGYDLFKEAKVRQFWARQPDSTMRPALLGRLYPYLAMSSQSPQLIREFYGTDLDNAGAFDFSHRIRWKNSGRVARFLSAATLDQVRGLDPAQAVLSSLPDEVRHWRPLARAQYLEVRTLMSQYLLSSQGDRMLMAHSVEGRFPFLDHRFADFSARLPDHLKLRGLSEKYLLKKVARGRVPDAVVDRPKFPYRAPIAEALAAPGGPSWSRELLARDAVDQVGVFDGQKVERLMSKLAKRTAAPSEADVMALMAVATTQLLADKFLGPRSLPIAHIDAVTLGAA